jgi:hypothetical protein
VEANTAMTTTNTNAHSHHWRIAEPNGQYSEAVCVSCGAEKQFRNWLSESDYITRSEVGLAA